MGVYNQGTWIWFPLHHLAAKPTRVCDNLCGGAAEGLWVSGDATRSEAGHLAWGRSQDIGHLTHGTKAAESHFLPSPSSREILWVSDFPSFTCIFQYFVVF